jgi:tetratricopeptide (TPR) repeat protein
MMGSLEDPLVRSILEEALEHAPEGAHEMRISALSQLSFVPPYGLDIARSKELSARALELANQLDDEGLLMRALNARLYALSGPDDCDELLSVASDMLARSGRPRAWVAAAALGARYGAHLIRGELGEARAARAELGRMARAQQWPSVIWFHDRLAVQEQIHDGDFAAAGDALQVLRANAERWAVPYAGELTMVIQGVLLLETHGAKALGADMDLSPLRVELKRAPLGMRPTIARLLLEFGDRETAQSVLELLSADDFAGIPREISYLGALASLGMLAIRLGDRERAQRVYDALLPYAHHNTPNVLLFYEGSVSHFLGLLAELLGLTERVQGHFEAAIAMNERLGARPQLARSRYELGRWLARGPSPAAK